MIFGRYCCRMLLSLLHRNRKWAVVSGSTSHNGQMLLHFFPAVLDVERGYRFTKSWALTVAFRMSSWDVVFLQTGCSFPAWHASIFRNSMVDIVLASSLSSFCQWLDTASFKVFFHCIFFGVFSRSVYALGRPYIRRSFFTIVTQLDDSSSFIANCRMIILRMYSDGGELFSSSMMFLKKFSTLSWCVSVPLWGERQVGGKEHSLLSIEGGAGCNGGTCGGTCQGAEFHLYAGPKLPARRVGSVLRTCCIVSLLPWVQCRSARVDQLPSDYMRSAVHVSLGFW